MRKYTVGINVNHIDELDGMGAKVTAFLADIGDGDLDLQLMVNPHGNEVDFRPLDVIGFNYVPDVEDDEEYYEDYEGETEDDE